MSPVGTDSQWMPDERARRGLLAPFLDQKLSPWNSHIQKPLERLLAAYPYVQGPEHMSKAIGEIMKEIWTLGSPAMTFDTFRKFEGFLVSSGYRGHFIHQFEVYLLGLNLLMASCKMADKNNIKYGDSVALAQNWLICAMGHDLGYPIQSARNITAKMSILYSDLGCPELSRNIKMSGDSSYTEHEERLLYMQYGQADDSIEGRFLFLPRVVTQAVHETLGLINDKTAKDLVNSLIKKDNHGIVSALMLARAKAEELVNSKERVDPTDYFLSKEEKSDGFKKALAAVSLHDVNTEPNPLSGLRFWDNPLAILLYLADNLQDWLRTYIPEERSWDYCLTDFNNNIEDISMKCNLLPTQAMDNQKEKFKEEINRKRKTLGIFKKTDDAPIGVRFTAEFTLRGESCEDVPSITFNL
jgi:hypothetical protein